jgi:hypothetical protein
MSLNAKYHYIWGNLRPYRRGRTRPDGAEEGDASVVIVIQPVRSRTQERAMQVFEEGHLFLFTSANQTARQVTSFLEQTPEGYSHCSAGIDRDGSCSGG